jgi:hypothetical protein
MKTSTGFGKVEPPKPKAEKNKAQRTAANQKYEEMKSSGLPEFNIYVRIKEKENWIPAGSMTVDRSSKISLAIYQQEKELLKGILRLCPKLRPYQDQLEYGYRLKQFNDEAIAVAAPPQPTPGSAIRAKFKQLQENFSKLLKQKS